MKKNMLFVTIGIVVALIAVLDVSPVLAQSDGGERPSFDKCDYDQAIADFDEAIALDPQDALAYANRGYAYYNLGDDDKAIADYERALELGLELSDHEAVEELLKELGQ